uniref:Uncharacterized protein n=1 Tax=Noccaea caerulescens TaxID=107243 RepID=A0A1J3K1T2_NOCCA
MNRQASAPASYVVGDEEWELCNEDGFIYKRLKLPEETAAGEASKPPDPDLDPAEEERNRRKRKTRILVKFKRKYQREIDHWEILSNNLCAMQEKANQFQNSVPEATSSIEIGKQIEKDASSRRSLLLDELLSVEEAREWIIQNVSQVCEIAEEISRVEEEEEKEMFFNLPVWGTPKDLMASLCYD